MRTFFTLFVLAIGCGSEARERVHEPELWSGPEPSIAEWLPEGHPAPHAHDLPPGHPPIEAHRPEPEAQTIAGTVRETMSSGGYTYMALETEHGLVWIAGVETEVAVGDRVEASGSEMRNFRSNTLDRTFDRLVLASHVDVTRGGER